MRVLILVLAVFVYGCSNNNSPVSSSIPTPERVRLTAHPDGDDTPIHETYDFRWSNWNDTKAKVTAIEPGALRIELHDGSGLSALESAWTSDDFIFATGDTIAVVVEYEFAGDEMFAGHYWFDETMTPPLTESLIEVLTDQYGATVEETDDRITWMKNGDTEVYITITDDGSGGCLHYYSPDADEKVEKAKNYNDLPVRPVVPDND